MELAIWTPPLFIVTYQAHQCAALIKSTAIEVLALFWVIGNHIFPPVASKKNDFFCFTVTTHVDKLPPRPKGEGM